MIDQLEFANVVLLNKIDLVEESEVQRIKKALNVLNPNAKVYLTKNSKVDLPTVVKTGLFDMDEASNGAGWLKSLREEMIPETEEYGISSFIYKASVPFHPKRLSDFLESMFFLELLTYDEDEEDEEGKSNGNSNGNANGSSNGNANGSSNGNSNGKEERDAEAARNIKTMKENYGSIFRSKGFIWIAGRDDLYGEWSQAGMMGQVQCGGAWIGITPKDELPEKGTEAYDLMMKDIQVRKV